MARNYAALPHEYIRDLSELSDEEVGRLVRALLRYSATGEVPTLEGNERFLWNRVMAQEDRFQESYEETVVFNHNRAKKAAAARWHREEDKVVPMHEDAQASVSIAQNAINKTETKTKTESESEPKAKTLPSSEGESYGAPTREEVASYARERNSSIDPGRFVDYHAALGWRIGNAPIRDWRAAFRNWERREKSGASPSSRPKEVFSGSCATPAPTAETVRTLERLELLRKKMRAEGSGSGRPPS